MAHIVRQDLYKKSSHACHDISKTGIARIARSTAAYTRHGRSHTVFYRQALHQQQAFCGPLPVGIGQGQHAPAPWRQAAQPCFKGGRFFRAALMPGVTMQADAAAGGQRFQRSLKSGQGGGGCGDQALVAAGQPAQVKNNAHKGPLPVFRGKRSQHVCQMLMPGVQAADRRG